MTLGRYNRIELVKLDADDPSTQDWLNKCSKEQRQKYEFAMNNCILLTGNTVVNGMKIGIDGFEVDLTGDCWFNTEFKVVERKTLAEVETIRDVYDFVNQHKDEYPNMTLYTAAERKDILLAGGVNKDMAIYTDLQFNWANDEETQEPTYTAVKLDNDAVKAEFEEANPREEEKEIG